MPAAIRVIKSVNEYENAAFNKQQIGWQTASRQAGRQQTNNFVADFLATKKKFFFFWCFFAISLATNERN